MIESATPVWTGPWCVQESPSPCWRCCLPSWRRGWLPPPVSPNRAPPTPTCQSCAWSPTPRFVLQNSYQNILWLCPRESLAWPGRHPRSNFVVRSYPAILCRRSWSWACGIIFRRKLCSMFMMQVRAAGIGVRILSDPHPSCGSGPHHFNGSGRIHIILTDPVGSAPFLRIRSIFTDPVGSLPVPFLRSRSDPHHFCGSGRIHTILTISFGSTPLWHALRENGGNINNSGQLGIWNGKSVPHQNSRSPKFWNVVLLCVTCTQEESCCSIWSFPGSSWSWSASGRTGPSSPTRLPSRRIIYQKTYRYLSSVWVYVYSVDTSR